MVYVLHGSDIFSNIRVNRSYVANDLSPKALAHSNVFVSFLFSQLINSTAYDAEANPGPLFIVSKTVTADYQQGDVSLFGTNAGMHL